MSATRGDFLAGTLASIFARLDQLEKHKRQRLSGALVPNYTTVDRNGNTGANFTGKVHAQGLDLDAGTIATPPDQDRVRWLRTSDGGVAADIIAFSIAGAPNTQALLLNAYALAAADISEAGFQAMDDTGTQRAVIAVTQTNRGATAQVQAGAGASQVVVIAQDGSSGFLQVTPFGGVTQPANVVNGINQPNTIRSTFVCLEHNFVCGGGQTESYQVLIGSANPPTVRIDEPFLSVAAGGATVQSINSTSFMLPPGWFYQLKQITHTGAAAFKFTESLI